MITVSVGQQQDQAVEAGVGHLRDVSGTPADGLDGGRRKRLILTLHIRLEHTNICLKLLFFGCFKTCCPATFLGIIIVFEAQHFPLKLHLRIKLKGFFPLTAFTSPY